MSTSLAIDSQEISTQTLELSDAVGGVATLEHPWQLCRVDHHWCFIFTTHADEIGEVKGVPDKHDTMVGRPITPSDLRPFIRQLAKDASRRAMRFRDLGLCVSGGPDSMALAYLFKGLETSHSLNLLGFIVDHKARPESTDEAEQVQKNLAKIGVNAKILTMEWPAGVQPSELSAFESQARKKRYQLLSEAALRYDMPHLLLGHHQDDQVETIFMRLIRDSTLSLKGLTGMKFVSPIPNGDVPDRLGIHTDRIPISLPVRGPFPPLPGPQSDPRDSEAADVQLMKVAMPGGPLLTRPLLNFTKSDLVATCESNKVPYIVDPTNKDPRSNLRNAVRHLRMHHQLPKALGAFPVLRLQRHAKKRIDRVIARGDAFLSTCKFLNLDLRVGSATVELPVFRFSTALERDSFAYAISMLTEMVTPNVRTEIGYGIPDSVISHLNDFGAADKGDTPMRLLNSSRNANRVQFSSKSHQTWVFSRQTMRPSEVQDNTNGFTINPRLDSSDKFGSEYMLWDNRFWFRVWAQTSTDLSDFRIRPMRQSDLDTLRPSDGPFIPDEQTQRTKLFHLIKKLTPNKSTNVIPVLTYKGRAVALPTFRYVFKETVQEVNLSMLKWDVMYNTFSLINQYPGLREWAEFKGESKTRIETIESIRQRVSLS